MFAYRIILLCLKTLKLSAMTYIIRANTLSHNEKRTLMVDLWSVLDDMRR